MNTNTQKDSAFKSLDVYLSALDNPESLRVNQCGDVERKSTIVVMFNRTMRSLKRAIYKNYSPTDWKQKASSAIACKLEKEITQIHGTLTQPESKLLKKFLKNMSTPSSSPWQEKISGEIASMKQKHQALAVALEKSLVIGRPENSALFPYVRPHMKNGDLNEVLENGLKDYMQREFGYEKDSAGKAAKTMAHVMTAYEVSVQEALAIASDAGKISIEGAIDQPTTRALPVALLKQRLGLNLNEADDLHKTIQGHKINLERNKIFIDLIHSLKADYRLKSLPDAQIIEIALLAQTKHTNKDEAILISLRAGLLSDDTPIDRSQSLREAENSLNNEITETFERASPAGWPDQWEGMTDGSRRLIDTNKFQDEYMNYLGDNIKTDKINDKEGFSEQFIKDVGRSNFNFSVDNNRVKIRRNAEEAMTQLRAALPEDEALKNLSKAINQSGHNALVYALGKSLGKNDGQLFMPIAYKENSEIQNASSDNWISVQPMTQDGKIRVGYTSFIKHFSLPDPDTGKHIPINPEYDASHRASASDHTAKATALMEFDIHELQRGIVNPVLVRPPELTLRLQLDRESYVKSLIDNELERLE